jgi:hypothetical protein
VKARTIYVADDRTRFDDEDECREYDKDIARIADVMAPLGPVPDDPGCHFANDGDYIQHDPAVVRAVKAALIEAGEKQLGWWYDKQRDMHGITREKLLDVGYDWFSRFLDGSHPALERAWHRLGCIDAMGREFGQPYYARNPKPDAKLWEPRS